ncbi:MAG: acyltransferase [Lachnospiraceae bacterium]|nr:acyltransferase [Lachnospiraceae bacterium]
MPENTRKRLNYADMMKGLAVAMVVVYHTVAPGSIKSFTEHMGDVMLATFFFYSGYFYNVGKKSFGSNVAARAKALLIPFFGYSFLFWLIGTIYLVVTGQAPLPECLACLRNFYGGCIWNTDIQNIFGWEYYKLGSRYIFLADLWFLPAMMFASILFFAIADFVLKNRTVACLTVFILFAVTGVFCAMKTTLAYNVHLVPFWAGIMLTGTWCRQGRVIETDKLSGKAHVALAAISTVMGIAVAMLKGPATNLFRGSFGTSFDDPQIQAMLLSVLDSALVIWGMSTICIMAENKGIRTKELVWLGRNSMSIYVYHMFFAWVISRVMGFSLKYEEPVSMSSLILSLIFAVVCLGLCAGAHVLKSRVKGRLARDSFF